MLCQATFYFGGTVVLLFNPNSRGEGGAIIIHHRRIPFFSATEHRMIPGLFCKFEFCHCGPVEKPERSICLGLVVAARQSHLGSKFLNLKNLNFFLLPQNFTTNQGFHSKFSHPTPRTAYQCAYAKEMR